MVAQTNDSVYHSEELVGQCETQVNHTLTRGAEVHGMLTGRIISLRNKATIHQVTTMLATSKNVLFPGHNHLLSTSTDNPTL